MNSICSWSRELVALVRRFAVHEDTPVLDGFRRGGAGQVFNCAGEAGVEPRTGIGFTCLQQDRFHRPCSPSFSRRSCCKRRGSKSARRPCRTRRTHPHVEDGKVHEHRVQHVNDVSEAHAVMRLPMPPPRMIASDHWPSGWRTILTSSHAMAHMPAAVSAMSSTLRPKSSTTPRRSCARA